MEKYSSIIVGKVTILGKDYDAELINDVLAIKCEIMIKEVNTILNATIEFIPIAKGGPIYYLFIDKKNTDDYSYTSYHVLLLYRHFKSEREIGFEIISKGFTNAVNVPIRNLKDPFHNIRKNLEKEFLKADVRICENEYKSCFINHGFIKNNNLCPADFSTGLKLIPKDNKFIDKISEIYNFAIKFLQFITLNSYPKIDSFIIFNDKGGYSEIEINDDYSKCDDANDKFLYIRCLNKNINKIIDAFPNAMTRQHNLYHYKSGWVFEFDIVRLSGTFEGVFRENVEKNKTYKKIIEKKKKNIHYNDLLKILNDFGTKYEIKTNDDFNACTMMLKEYAGTLKNKLEFVLNDFCETMNMIVIDTGLFYSAKQFETRIKDSRNSICHGLNKKKIKWKSIGNDTLLLQELIYFMLLKYKMKISSSTIKMILDESFGHLNSQLFLYKKDDPRIEWSK